MMKKLCTCALALILCMMMTTIALADRMYVLPDSNKRKLTWDEVAEWDYESLGYAFNEIFARHGYNFVPGLKYDYYFSTMPWYEPNPNPDNEVAVYPYLTDTEWYNYDLIKAVRAFKQHADWGRSIWDVFSTGFDTLQGFEYVELRSNQTMPVYSAPTTASWRGANGKAEVSTNGAMYIAGWESGWLLVMYETNNGSVRVGYINGAQLRGNVPVNTYLNFEYITATTLDRCVLTDDPARTGSSITTLPAGATVTYLTTYFNRRAWDYVEVTVNGTICRGFIEAGSLDVSNSVDPLDNLNYNYNSTYGN